MEIRILLKPVSLYFTNNIEVINFCTIDSHRCHNLLLLIITDQLLTLTIVPHLHYWAAFKATAVERLHLIGGSHVDGIARPPKSRHEYLGALSLAFVGTLLHFFNPGAGVCENGVYGFYCRRSLLQPLHRL